MLYFHWSYHCEYALNLAQTTSYSNIVCGQACVCVCTCARARVWGREGVVTNTVRSLSPNAQMFEFITFFDTFFLRTRVYNCAASPWLKTFHHFTWKPRSPSGTERVACPQLMKPRRITLFGEISWAVKLRTQSRPTTDYPSLSYISIDTHTKHCSRNQSIGDFANTSTTHPSINRVSLSKTTKERINFGFILSMERRNTYLTEGNKSTRIRVYQRFTTLGNTSVEVRTLQSSLA